MYIYIYICYNHMEDNIYYPRFHSFQDITSSELSFAKDSFDYSGDTSLQISFPL